jgi:hypothetical protein
MKKYTKIGLSALCGSLASISAVNAGTLDVTGTAAATWTSLGGQVTGNPIGMTTGITFKGSGELDGGQTFDVTITHAAQDAYSVAGITLNTNSSGTFKLSSAEGSGGIGGYDDNMPTAWEEVWGTGITTNANFQKGVGSSTNVNWTSPKVVGTKLHIAYAPDNDGVANVNKAVSGSASDAFGSGWDAVLDTGTENGGINLFLGASVTDQTNNSQTNLKDLGGDHEEGVVGLKFKIGPVEIGGQVSAERIRTQTAGANNYYGNSSYGIAFNVNDNLSVSYARARHVATKNKKRSHLDASGTNYGRQNGHANINEYTPKSWMRGDSLQVAYTVGGVGLKYAQTDYDNTAYGFDAKTARESRLVQVSLAF